MVNKTNIKDDQKPTKRKQRSAYEKASDLNADVLGPSLVFVISASILILLGLVMIFSASSVEAINLEMSPYHYLVRQVLFLAISLIIGYLIFKKMPFSFLQGNAIYWITAVVLLLLLLTMVLGESILGAKRWINVGPVSLQPSEFAKICLVFVTAKLYFEYHTYKISLGRFLISLFIFCGTILATILFGQTDLGSTIICFVGIIAVFWLAGAPLYIIGAICAIPVFIAICATIFTPYRLERLFVFIDPYNDGENGLGAGYQYIRSRYALAEGGLFGLGLGNSFEKYQYLPESETDYIFAIICEELGMIGGIIVALIFIVFLISGLLVARSCKSSYATCVSGALVIMLTFQAFVNIFCVVGMFPTTGKPLPFISYGGSSLLSSVIIVFLVLAAAKDSGKQEVYERRQGWISSLTQKFTSNSEETISRIKTIDNQAAAQMRNKSNIANVDLSKQRNNVSNVSSAKNANYNRSNDNPTARTRNSIGLANSNRNDRRGN